MNILISGASKGIGRELALKFSFDPENNILVIARSEKLLIKLSEEAEHNNISIELADINKLSKEPEKLLKRVKQEYNQLDILINNAGYLVPKSFEDMTSEDDDTLISTNFTAPMQFIRALLPIIPSSGHIVNISSMAGFQGASKYPGLSVYGAAKGALSILSESLAREFGSNGPSINTLSLGAVQTEMLETAFPGYKAPLQPNEMAEFIHWFALNGNKFFNGRNLPVTLANP
jgi:short-subunit dehydrogenase